MGGKNEGLVMALNLPRERKGVVLRPQFLKVSDTEAWWVVDDLGPVDGPHQTQDEAWDRACELYAEYAVYRQCKWRGERR